MRIVDSYPRIYAIKILSRESTGCYYSEDVESPDGKDVALAIGDNSGHYLVDGDEIWNVDVPWNINPPYYLKYNYKVESEDNRQHIKNMISRQLGGKNG